MTTTELNDAFLRYENALLYQVLYQSSITVKINELDLARAALVKLVMEHTHLASDGQLTEPVYH